MNKILPFILITLMLAAPVSAVEVFLFWQDNFDEHITIIDGASTVAEYSATGIPGPIVGSLEIYDPSSGQTQILRSGSFTPSFSGMETIGPNTYNGPGDYTITLKAEDNAGDYKEKDITLNVISQVQASAFANPTFQKINENIAFSCQASGGDTSSYTYSWTFGDGTSSNQKNPTKDYNNPNTYTATCTVSDGYSQDSAQVTVTVINPVPDFTISPSTIYINDDVTFTSTSQPQQHITWYGWDLDNDGQVDQSGSSLTQAVFSYEQTGQKQVTLHVKYNDQFTETKTKSFTVVNRDFSSITVAADPTSGHPSFDVDFTCTAQGGDLPITYEWDFDDGTTSTQQNPTHTYTTLGTFEAKCTATDANGDELSDLITIQSVNQDPIFSNVQTQYFQEHSWFSLDLPVSDPDNDPISCYAVDIPSWAALDEQDCKLNGFTPFVNSNTLTFQVTLGVQDSFGATDEESFEIKVTNVNNDPNLLPIADQFVDEREDFELQLTVIEPDGDSYTCQATTSLPSWLSLDPNTCEFSGTAPSVDNNIATDITVRAQDIHGATDEESFTLTVQNVLIPPVPDFTVYPAEPIVGRQVTIVSNSYDPDGTITYYMWDYDNDGNIDEQGPQKSVVKPFFNTAGWRTIVLYVVDNDGQQAFIDKPVFVKDEQFTGITFTAIPQSGVAPLEVDFECEAFGGDDPISYVIEFGDRQSSNNRIVSHTYRAHGNYTATCTAIDASGNTIGDSKLIQVIKPNSPPVMNPIPDHDVNENTQYTRQLEVSDIDNDPLTCFDASTQNSNKPPIDSIYDPLPSWLTLDPQDCSLSGFAPEVIEDLSYTFLLGVQDPFGAQDTESFTLTVKNVNKAPIADFQWFPQNPVANTQVDIISNSYDPDGTIIHYYWDLDNDDVYELNGEDLSVVQNTFAAAGSYPVKHMVIDDDGDMDEIQKTITVIDNQFLDLEFEANPQSGVAPLEVEFSCNAIGGDLPISYEITFGDDSAASNNNNVVHTYQNPGVYTATCTATDLSGDIISDSLVIDVQTPPIADFEWFPYAPLAGRQVTFVSQSFDPDGTITYYQWDLDGDGKFDEEGPDKDVIKPVYDKPGDYLVTLVVTDDDGLTAQAQDTISIIDNKFFGINFIADPLTGDAPLDVQFSCEAFGGDLPIGYDIDFGDGYSSSNNNVMHTYNTPGEYIATCLAVDANGDTISDSLTITVDNANRPPSIADINDHSIAENTEYFLALQVSDPDNDPLTCFAVNTLPGWLTLDEDKCTLAGTAPEVEKDIDFNIEVGVRDPEGLEDETQFTLTVININQLPVAQFIFTPENPLSNEVIQFTSQSYDTDGFITDYLWDMDDDGTFETQGQNPTYVYPQTGTYKVTHKVIDNDGGEDMVEQFVSVGNSAFFDMDFMADPLTGDAPLEVDFTCEAFGGDEPVTYVIDFGDNTPVSNQRIVTHTYNNVGDYTATCTATDANGDTISDDVTIEVTQANRAPMIQDVNDHSIPELEFYSIQFQVSDPDNDPLVCFDAGIPLPSWLTLDAQDCSLSGTAPEVDKDENFIIEVGVRDPSGLTDTTYYYLTVLNINKPPVADFTHNPISPLTNEVVFFTSTSYDPDGFIIEYLWDMDNDGTFETQGQNPTYTFTTVGTHTVAHKVKDNGGLETTTSKDIIVRNEVFFSIDFTADPQSGDAPLDVQFTCSAQGGDAPIAYEITFGDGFSSTQNIVLHTYTEPDTYVATCTATDVNGDTISDSLTIIVDHANRAPVMQPIPDQFVNETYDFFYQLEVSDPDNDPLVCFDNTFSASNSIDYLPDWLTLDEQTCQLYGTAPEVNNDLAYFISVGVRDPEGLEDTQDFTLTVLDLNKPPVADFEYTPLSPLTNEVVFFTSTSYDSDGFIIEYLWDLDNDGTFETVGQTPTYVFDTVGTHTVSHKVTDNKGLQDEVSKDIVITNSVFFDLDFTAVPQSGDAPLDVQFSCTAQGGDNPITYEIVFGDGASTTQNVVSHTYNNVGDYIATCTATDANGDTISESLTIEVFDPNQAPVADFEYTPLSPLTNEVVFFTSTSYDVDGFIVEYLWDLDDDGTFETSGETPTHVFSTIGTHTVSHKVTDNEGLQDEVSKDIVITNSVFFDMTFTANPQSGDAPLDVQFTCSAEGGDNPITYEIVFGDGSSTTQNVVSHTYNNVGSYVATCTATDANNDTISESLTIDVTQANRAPMIADVADHSIPELQFYEIDFEVSDPDNDPLVCYDAGIPLPSWLTLDAQGCSLSGYAPEVDADENFIIEVGVRDPSGLTDTTYYYLTVLNINKAPVADFVYSPTNPLTNEVVLFTSTSYDPDGFIIEYLWDLDNDGTFETQGATPTHTFATVGTHTVTHKVTDNEGLQDEVSKDIVITNTVFFDLDFTAVPQSGDAPLDVQFTCNAQGGDNPITYEIVFGDGASTTQNVVSHTYNNVGSYTATCTATDVNGDTISESLTIDVFAPNQAPVADFVYSPLNPLTNEVVLFTSTSYDPDGFIIEYLWDLDNDGIFETSGETPTHTFATVGTHTVTHKVTDNEGLQDEVSKDIVITNTVFFDLDFTAVPQSGDAPLDVDFTCTAEGGDNPVTYEIVFGDGTSTTQNVISHTYNNVGSYVATCTATDVNGDTISESLTIDVFAPNQAPVADFVYSPLTPLTNEVVFFTSTSYDSDGFIVEYLWDLDDDGVFETQGQTPTYAFDTVGIHTVTHKVTDNEGLQDEVSKDIVITNTVFFDLDFTADPQSGDAPLDVQFACNAQGGDNPITYEIVFGDGASTTQNVVSHTYNNVGSYVATCTATDVNGDTISDSLTIVVDNANRAPVMQPIPDQFVNETYDFFYQLEVSDPDNDPLVCFDNTFSASNNIDYLPDWLTLDPQTCQLYGTAPEVNNDLPYFISVGVRDPEGLEDTQDFILTVLDLNKPPVADFIYSPTNPLTNEVVFFTSTSYDVDGFIVEYLWDLDDDGTFETSGQTPTYVFDAVGTHTVSHKVTDNKGLQDEVSKDITITNTVFFDLDFTAVPQSGDAPLDVQFTCTAQGGDNPITYEIVFGDGSSTTQNVVSHTYNNVGTYIATCIATDANNDTISELLTIEVMEANLPPVADFQYSPLNPLTNEVVFFTSTSYDVDGFIVEYLWDLDNDGTFETSGETPTHVFNTVGTHTVTHKVTDNEGLQDEVSKDIVITNTVFFDLDFTANPQSGDVPLDVQFSCNAQGGDNPITYEITFGDGSSTVHNLAAHTYTEVGTYIATCIATDANNDTISESLTIEVFEANLPPVADFEYSPLNPLTNEVVFFTSTSYDPDGFIVEHLWDLDNDGVFETSGETPTHVFTQVGIYTITHKVTDNEGLQDSISKEITITNSAFLDLDFTADPQGGVAPLDVQFTCTAQGGDDPVTYEITFGDGSSTTQNSVLHTYPNVGTYTATCTATDANNDTISESLTIEVTQANIAPVADFIYSPTSPLTNEVVFFTSTSYDSDGYIIEYLWDMDNDGTFETSGETPTHVFNTVGTHTVSHKVTDNEGLQDQISKDIVITNTVFFDMTFTADPQSGDAPLDVQFTCNAQGGDAPVAYEITFGDGASNTQSSIQHTYASPGTYIATCTATDANNDSIERSLTIAVAQPNGAPVIEPIDIVIVNETDNVYVQVVASDPDNDPLTYSLTSHPSFITIDENTGLITGVAPFVNENTDFNVVVKAMDPMGLYDDEEFILRVLDNNDGFIVLDEFGCNPNVERGKREYCSAHVVDNDGNDVINAEVTIIYIDPANVQNEHFGTCTTNVKGYCHVDPVVDKEPGYYTVQATAFKENFTQSNSMQDTFRVWEARYNVEELEIFEDENFQIHQDTFFRAEDMYAEFSVYDRFEQQFICDPDIITQVFLRVNNDRPLNFSKWEELNALDVDEPNFIERLSSLFGYDTHCSFRYWLPQIPISDDYLGDGRVFAFAFNFTDNTIGQASREVTVLNNPVVIDLPDEFVISKYDAGSVGQLTIDFKEYVEDVETLDEDMIYSLAFLTQTQLQMQNEGIGVYKFTAPEGFVDDTTIELTVDDTDGSIESDTTIIRITTTFEALPPIAIAGDDQNTTVGVQITVDGSESYDPDGGDIVLYEWDFGDSNTATGVATSHTFTETGVYTVTLTVTDDEGQTDTDTLIVTVDEPAHIPQCNDGIDNDGDGLVDLRDPGCESLYDDDEFNIVIDSDYGLRIHSIDIVGQEGLYRTVAGDIIEVTLVLENIGDEDLDDLKIGFLVPELGVKQYSSHFDLREGKTQARTMDVYIPYDAPVFDDYYTQITVHNGDIRRSTHRFLEVLE